MAQPDKLTFTRLRRQHAPAPRRPLLRAGLVGVMMGLTSACVIEIGGSGWYGEDGHSIEACFEVYDDCMDEVDGHEEIVYCNDALDSCIEACEAETGGEDDSGNADSRGDGDSGDGDPGDPGDGDGDNPPRGDGDGDEDPNAACFELHANCVAEATTIQDIEACEALFDNCVDPGPCHECPEPGCPQDELDACVATYAACAAAAISSDDILACEADFDGCIGGFDISLCLPNYDDELVAACLEQHDLCVACADDADALAACMTTFDNCLEA